MRTEMLTQACEPHTPSVVRSVLQPTAYHSAHDVIVCNDREPLHSDCMPNKEGGRVNLPLDSLTCVWSADAMPAL
jgi:hypothetical protein